MRNFHPLVYLVVATLLEVTGDAIVRIAIYKHVGLTRLLVMLAGAALLFGYGVMVNLAPLEFGQVAGLYIAMVFVVWQVVNYLTFRALPTLPIILGGALVVIGGLIVSFWKPGVPA